MTNACQICFSWNKKFRWVIPSLNESAMRIIHNLALSPQNRFNYSDESTQPIPFVAWRFSAHLLCSQSFVSVIPFCDSLTALISHWKLISSTTSGEYRQFYVLNRFNARRRQTVEHDVRFLCQRPPQTLFDSSRRAHPQGCVLIDVGGAGLEQATEVGRTGGRVLRLGGVDVVGAGRLAAGRTGAVAFGEGETGGRIGQRLRLDDHRTVHRFGRLGRRRRRRGPRLRLERRSLVRGRRRLRRRRRRGRRRSDLLVQQQHQQRHEGRVACTRDQVSRSIFFHRRWNLKTQPSLMVTDQSKAIRFIQPHQTKPVDVKENSPS